MASTVAHQSTLIAVLSLQCWSSPGLVLPILTVHQKFLSSLKFVRQPITMFLNVTHHEVLDCIAASAFQKLHLVMRAELIAELLRLS